jgi:predicted DNA-binding transcriptional regulator AlpA
MTTPTDGRRERLYSVKDLADFFGCSRSQIYEWLRRGYLPPPYKRFGQKKWSIQEVDDWNAQGYSEGEISSILASPTTRRLFFISCHLYAVFCVIMSLD